MNFESPHHSGSDDHEAWFEVAIDHAHRELADALSETFRSLRKRLYRTAPQSPSPVQDHGAALVEPQSVSHPDEPENSWDADAAETLPDSQPPQQHLPFTQPIEEAPESPADFDIPQMAPVPHPEPVGQTSAPLPTPDFAPVQTSSFFPGQPAPSNPTPQVPAPTQATYGQAPNPIQTPIEEPLPSPVAGKQYPQSPPEHEIPVAVPVSAPVPQQFESPQENVPQALPTPELQRPSPVQIAPVAPAVDPAMSPFLTGEQKETFVPAPEGFAPGIADALPPKSPILSKEAEAMALSQENAFLPGVPLVTQNNLAGNTQELDAALDHAFESESRPKTSEIYRPPVDAPPVSSPIASPFEQVTPPQQPGAQQSIPASLFEPPGQQQPFTGQLQAAVGQEFQSAPGIPFPAQPPHTAEFPPRPVTPHQDPALGNAGIFPQSAPQGPFELTSPPAEPNHAAPQTPQQFPGQPAQNRSFLPQAPNGDDVMLKGSNDDS